jgi:outer membrane lipoprotein-sorting protein
MTKIHPSVFLVLWVIAACIGCAPKTAPLPAVMPSAPAEEILKGLSGRIPEDAVLRSKARFTARSEEGRFSTGIVLLAQRPGNLRIESLSIMGLPEIVLTANRKRLKIFAVREEKFYIGSADQDLSRFFPIYLSAKEAVSLIFGIPPQAGTVSTLRSRMENNLYRIDLSFGTGTEQTMWLDPGRLHLMKFEKYEGGESLYSAEFKDYGKVSDAGLPGRIDIRFNRPNPVDLTLRFSESDLEKGAEEEFDIDPPEGVMPIYLE